MTSTFTPVPIDMDKPRDWASDIGMLDWDKSAICFTKRNLLDFLKSVGVTVGSNLNEINKLPQYATLGKLTANTGATNTNGNGHAAPAAAAAPSKPSNNMFGDDDTAPAPSSSVQEVTMAASPPPPPHADKYSALPIATEPSTPTPSAALEPLASQQQTQAQNQYVPADEPEKKTWRPTRRVTHAPGGASSMGGMLGGDNEDEEDQFAASNARRGRI